MFLLRDCSDYIAVECWGSRQFVQNVSEKISIQDLPGNYKMKLTLNENVLIIKNYHRFRQVKVKNPTIKIKTENQEPFTPWTPRLLLKINIVSIKKGF
jgi:hypothetical protein